MGESISAPRGGFFRGMLAGLILVVLIFCGLAAGFPLSAKFDPSVAPSIEIPTSSIQPEIVEQESYGAISLPSESPAPTVFGANPVPFQTTAADVNITAAVSAPVNAVSTLETMPTSSGIELGEAEDEVPVVVVPAVESLSTIASPVFEETSEAPVVVESQTPVAAEQPVLSDVAEPDQEVIAGENTSLEKPAGGFALSGQTIIQPDAIEETSLVENTSSTTSFVSFKQPFENTSDLPLFAFVLQIEDAAAVDAVLTLPVPVTFAVDVSNPDTSMLVSYIRDAGREAVLLLSSASADSLKSGGSPNDVAPYLNSALSNANGVIGVMDGPDGNINQDPRMMTALLSELSKTGHAVITVDGVGRNRAEIMAKEADVPVASIANVFGPEVGKVDVIRGLDKVILQMGGLKSVTVYAPATSDLVSALKFWLKSQKSQLVTIAPISAVVLLNE